MTEEKNIDENLNNEEELKSAENKATENIEKNNKNADEAPNAEKNELEVDLENNESKSKDGIFNKIKNKIKGEPKIEEVSELDKMKLAKEEIDDKYVRLYAEFDNYRRRTAKEKLETIKTAGRDIIADLLPIVDDFERAKKAIDDATEKNTEPDYSGYDLIQNKLLNLLTNKGLKAMETNEQTFDADLHEALTEIPAPNDDLKGKIIDTIEKGYTLNEVIIRHAKVVIGK